MCKSKKPHRTSDLKGTGSGNTHDGDLAQDSANKFPITRHFRQANRPLRCLSFWKQKICNLETGGNED
jgi:hypothetical protein